MKDKTSKNPFRPIVDVFSRYNLVIFIVVVVSGLITSIIILNNILQIPYNSKTSETTDVMKFDEATITRVNTLNTSGENLAEQQIPSGRINLFSE